MRILTRTNAGDHNFRMLVKALDLDLQIRDGDEHAFYAALNTTDTIRHVIVAYEGDEPVGCGAVRPYSANTMEVKRMYVVPEQRGRGIASAVLAALEDWCRELQFGRCILETGENQPEAIALYTRRRYRRIANFGKYAGVANSVCFEKLLG